MFSQVEHENLVANVRPYSRDLVSQPFDMDLVGLFVFSVSMVIFGAYQAIPVLINRHDPGLHIRFRKGFGIGHMFGSANKAACLFPSSDKSAEIISKAPNTEFNEILTGFPLNFVTRTNATLISPPERVSDAQFGLHLSSLAAEKAKDFRLSVCGWVKRRLQSSSQVTKRKRPSLIHIRRNFDGTVLFGLGCISVAMFGIFLVAGWNLYRLYIASDAKSISKTPGSAQVDLSLVETIRRKKLFLECMGSLEETLSKLMRQMEEAVNQRQNEVETALTSVDALFDTDDDRQATDTILNDVSKAENQLISFSVIDDTLSNLVAALRTIVKTARHDLQVGIKDVKRVPPELAVPITQPTAQLRDDSLDDSAKAIKYETKRLEMVLMQMRAAIKSCMPGGKVDNLLRELVHDYKMLDEQAKITREHIHSVKLQLKRLKDVDVFEIQHKLLNAQVSSGTAIVLVVVAEEVY